MKVKKIYSKKYNNYDMIRFADKVFDNMSKEEKDELYNLKTDLLNEISSRLRKSTYVPISGYQKKRRRFIITAIRYSQKHKIDINIVELFGMVAVELSIEKAVILSELKPLVEIADDVMILKKTLDFGTVLLFVLHTHKRRFPDGDFFK